MPSNSTDYVVEVHLTGDDAAYVYDRAADRTTFNDVTVWDTADSAPRQLDVDIDQDTDGRWSRDNVTLWFKLQRPLAAAPATDDGYTLAWGNRDARLMQSWTNMYPFQDNFSSTTVDPKRWSTTGKVSIKDGFVSLTSPDHQSGPPALLQATSAYGPGYAMTTRMALFAGGTGQYGGALLAQAGPNPPWIRIDNSADYNSGGNWIGNDWDLHRNYNVFPGPFDSAFRTYTAARDPSGAMYVYRDDDAPSAIDGRSTRDKLIPMLEADTGNQGNVFTMRFDWVKVRPWIADGPSVSVALSPTPSPSPAPPTSNADCGLLANCALASGTQWLDGQHNGKGATCSDKIAAPWFVPCGRVAHNVGNYNLVNLVEYGPSAGNWPTLTGLNGTIAQYFTLNTSSDLQLSYMCFYPSRATIDGRSFALTCDHTQRVTLLRHVLAGRHLYTEESAGEQARGTMGGWFGLFHLAPAPSPVSPAPNPSPVPNPSPPTSPTCSTRTFVGVAVKVMPACGKVGDVVTVTVLNRLPRGYDGSNCRIIDQISYGRTYGCAKDLAMQFRVLPGGGLFEVDQPVLDTYFNPPTFDTQRFTAAADYYCVDGSTFSLHQGASTTYTGLHLKDGPQFSLPGTDICGSPHPAPVQVPHRYPEHPNCLTPDIQVHKPLLTIDGKAIDTNVMTVNAQHPLPRAFRPDSGYPSIVATFCDNDPKTNTHDYTADVTWAASYSPGDEVHPGASLYGPGNQSDIDPAPKIVTNPAYSACRTEQCRQRTDRWAVQSDFMVQSPGHIRIFVVVRKTVHGGAISAVEDTVQIHWPEDKAAERAGADAPDQHVLLEHDRQYNPWFAVGFLNNHRPLDTPADVSSRAALSRAIVSALTSTKLSTGFCQALVQGMVTAIGPGSEASYESIADDIAANASAADWLLECAPFSQISYFANHPTKDYEPDCTKAAIYQPCGATDYRVQLLWKIAATAFLDNMNYYANCDNMADCDQSNIRLMPIAQLAAATFSGDASVAGLVPTDGYHMYGSLTYMGFLEHGIALRVLATLPHPILCKNNGCGPADHQSRLSWTSATGNIIGALNEGIVLNNLANKQATDKETTQNNLLWGIGTWAVGLLIPEVLPAGVADLGGAAFGVTTAIVGVYLPPADGNYSDQLANDVWDAEFIGLLIESHAIYDTTHHSVMVAGYQRLCSHSGCRWESVPFSKQITEVLSNGTPPSCRANPLYDLANDYLEDAGNIAGICDTVFERIHDNAKNWVA